MPPENVTIALCTCIHVAPSTSGEPLQNLNLPFILILRRFEVVF